MKIPPRKFSPESVGDGRKTSPVRSETNEGKKTKFKKKTRRQGDQQGQQDKRNSHSIHQITTKCTKMVVKCTSICHTKIFHFGIEIYHLATLENFRHLGDCLNWAFVHNWAIV
jgi:hypothetical protein